MATVEVDKASLENVYNALKNIFGENDDSKRFGNFLRALVFFLAGIIAISTAVAGAVVNALASSLQAAGNPQQELFVNVYSEVTSWLAVTIFTGTIAAGIIQVLRFYRKNSINKLLALGAVILLIPVLLGTFFTTETAICGSTALSMEKMEPQPTIDDKLHPLVKPFFFCSQENDRWKPFFKPEKAKNP